LPVALFEPPQPATTIKIAIKPRNEKSTDVRMRELFTRLGGHSRTLAQTSVDVSVRSVPLATHPPVRHCGLVPARLRPESPGLNRLVEIARECNRVDLITLRDFGLEDVWLEPGERFPCDRTMAAELIRAGLAERVVKPS
jgi:hypothetical protein